jgi:hypothetical protein
MKYFAVTIFVLIVSLVKGQSFTVLEEFGGGDRIFNGQAVIYGNFIQRLGFSSGGFPQDIRLLNIDTKEILTFRVKPTFKSAKENTFCYVIVPGTYAILNYWWTESKWYGGKMFTEPIYKGVDATGNFFEKLSAGQIKQDELVQFTFTVTDKSLNYLGTWHFDKGIVSFTDDKVQFDSKISAKFQRLNFSVSKTVLPN